MPKHIDQDTGREFPLYPSPEWLADVEQFNREACQHDTKELRRASVSNGAIHIRHQCLHCGELIGSAVSKADAPKEMRDADLNLRTNYQAERKRQRDDIDQKHIRLQREDGNAFKKRHLEYLASAAWKVKRDKVLRRANGVCEGCLEAEAREVHHLTYEHWGNELMFELVALCPACHAKCHPGVEAEDEPVEPPCYGCRYVDWDQSQTMLCGKFGVLAMNALLPGGDCGPDARELEPLK